MTTIVWFRQDLRVADNPALFHASKRGPVLPVFILDETETPGLGGASKWWLHHSLQSLSSRFSDFVLLRGDPQSQLLSLIDKTGADAVFWNRCYEPHAVSRDKAIKAHLNEKGIDAQSCNANLLHEPWELKTGSGGPFKVYSPFWRVARSRPVEPPLAEPAISATPARDIGMALEELDLRPSNPDWAAGWQEIWQPGEYGALAGLESFLENGLSGYAGLRDRPDLKNVSRLSPHLHFGEISPRQIWAKANFLAAGQPELARDVEKFLSELCWREFAYHLLYHFPTIPDENWKRSFNAYAWRDSEAHLEAWQRGMTGYPIVDAGMRELWNTGYMHNRVRMIAASFLVKHLRIDWRLGAAWFWDTLVDADLANNASGWQWVAGSGADAAPYFRVFNPMLQGRKFDPEGSYIRRWCPEIARLGNDHIHAPFEASQRSLFEAGVKLGETYPKPLVDHQEARKAALAGYEAVKAFGDGR
ncbi:MAG: deoxyribodipyrimidine photo-lyase [Rhizobiaceae bacterium]